MMTIRVAVPTVLIIWSLCSCSDLSTANEQSARNYVAAPSKGVLSEASDVKIVFHNFHNQATTFKVNDRIVYQGVLTYDRSKNSAGIALILPIKLSGETVFELYADNTSFKTMIAITPDIKVVYVNPRRQPFIKTSSDPTVLLE